MKYILSTILLLGSIVSSAQNQDKWCPDWVDPNYPTNECINYSFTPATVYTPNNSPVPVQKWVSGDWSQNTKDAFPGYWQSYHNNTLIVEGEATIKYNCHEWAWYGRTDFSMYRNSAQIFFSSCDQSYVLTTSTHHPSIVWFDADDHSAETTSTAGYFVSKWGDGPRFKHPIKECPYRTTNFFIIL